MIALEPARAHNGATMQHVRLTPRRAIDWRSRFADWPLALRSIAGFWLFYLATVLLRALLGPEAASAMAFRTINAVVGVGLNVSGRPVELAALATSLALESAGGGRGPMADPRQSTLLVLESLLASLNRRLSDDPALVLEAWRARDALRGSRISWREGEGTAVGVDDTGALLVDTEDRRVALQAGEVHLTRV